MVNAQEYINQKYPSKEERNKIKKLEIRSRRLTNDLDLSDFVNLEELHCQDNQLTALKLDNCWKLKKLNCLNNQLIKLDLTNCNQIMKLWCNNNYLQELTLPSQAEQLTTLDLSDNSLLEQDLSIFRNLTSLKELWIGNNDQKKINQGIYNRFIGSLEFLCNLNRLKTLVVSNTDISSGFEHLPESIEKFSCAIKQRPEAECRAIYNLFAGRISEHGRVNNFSQELRIYKQKKQKQTQVEIPPKK